MLAEEDADAAHNTLTALHGIGPWTADVYLLFCLGHGDAWPAGDLAVQEAVKVGLGLKARPTAKQMAPLAEPWRPLRGAAAHLWWSYYRVLKKREGVLASKLRCSCPGRGAARKCLLRRAGTHLAWPLHGPRLSGITACCAASGERRPFITPAAAPGPRARKP